MASEVDSVTTVGGPRPPLYPPPARMASEVVNVTTVGAPIAAAPAADWDNQTFVIAQVRRRGSDLQFASARLTGDIDVVAVAENQDPDSVRYASFQMIGLVLDMALDEETRCVRCFSRTYCRSHRVIAGVMTQASPGHR